MARPVALNVLDNERNLEIFKAYRDGKSFRELGLEHHISAERARQIYWAVVKEVPFAEVSEYRLEQLERIGELRREAIGILNTKHITISNGQVVIYNGQPVLDDGPRLNAILTLLKIEERQAKLLGLDAPARAEISVQSVNYTIVGIPTEALH